MLARDGAGALGSGRGDPGARGSDARASAHLTSLFKIKILQRFYGKTLATVALSGLMETFVVSKDERTRRLPTAAFGRRPSGPGLRSGATGPALRPEPRRAPSTLRWSRCSRRFPAGLGCPASQIGAGSSVPAPNRPLPQQRPRRLSSRSDVRCPSTKHGCLSHFYIVPKLENSSQNERQPEREREGGHVSPVAALWEEPGARSTTRTRRFRVVWIRTPEQAGLVGSQPLRGDGDGDTSSFAAP